MPLPVKSRNTALSRRAFLTATAASLSRLAAAASQFAEVAVFQAGADGYHTYRIPALITTKRGTLVAICEGRKNNRNDHGDIDLVVKRSEDAGRTWSAQKGVYEEGGTAEVTIGNPCPVVDDGTGTIWLPFTRDNNHVFVTSSRDDGVTWTAPRDITAQVKKDDWSWYATGPGVGIQIRRGKHKGRLVIPCDHREEVAGRGVKMSHVFYSDDRGRNWKLGGSVANYTDECQVVELADGSLLINMRNYWEREGGQPEKGRKRAISRSTDGGLTWSELLFDETLIEPVCQASFVRFTLAGRGSKDRLLFSNPASREIRVRMTVRMSYDEGKSWPVEKLVYEGPSAYSCLTVLRDKSIGLLYERGRENPYEEIAFARFNLEWLTDGSAWNPSWRELKVKPAEQGHTYNIVNIQQLARESFSASSLTLISDKITIG